jgi:RNA polymerase sigma factor (sigma-70 family)
MANSRTSEVIRHLCRAVLQDAAGLTDAELLGRFIDQRDEDAFAALVRRHGPMVWGTVRRLVDHHDPEDTFQAVFLVLFRKAASIRPRELLANWLHGVARQAALQARRAAGRRRTRERQVNEMPEPEAPQQALWDDPGPVLDQELSRLPERYRVVVLLCDLEGKARKEVARQLGCPEGTVAGRLARARVMLAKRLARHGVMLSGGALAAVITRGVAPGAVPISAISSTIKAAALLAAGQSATTGAISIKVAALTQGVLNAMTFTRLKVTTVLVLLGLVAFGGELLTRRMAAAPGDEAKKPLAEGKKRGAVAPGKGAIVDLTKIDRKIRKEPRYQGKPRYGLLVLGPKAETRIWLVIDGATLYVDRNGNGDLTEKGEQVQGRYKAPDFVEFQTGEIVQADGKTKHSDLIVCQYYARQFKAEVNGVYVKDAIGKLTQGATGENGCAFAEKPKGAPIIHVAGPLTMRLYSVWVNYPNGKKLKDYSYELNRLVEPIGEPGSKIKEVAYELRAGEKVGTLQAQVGTPGVGRGTFAAIGVEQGLQAALHPVAEITYPNDPEPIKLKCVLKERCCGTLFSGSVPESAEKGKARIKLTFPDWKQGKVAAGVVDLPLVPDRKPKK